MDVKKIFLIFIGILILSIGVLRVSAQMQYSGQQASSYSYGSTGFSGSSGYGGYVNTQPSPTLQSYYGSGISTYWPILGNQESCQARQDLLLNVPIAGCQPAVVRSDLLADQNVPVFCQIESVKTNPLIDINSIRSMSFVGQYPPEVAGTGFYPARAALRSGQVLLGAPLANNIGYVVVVLKRQPDESKLPDFINVTFGAQIDYISGNALGIGANEFILSPMSESQWQSEKYKQSFWNGRYFIRLDEAQTDFATVSIYNGDLKVITQRVQRGASSQNIYLPGLYCRAGLQISYDGFVPADQTAKIEVSGDQSTDVFDVAQGSSFLNGRCTVNYMQTGIDGQSGRVVLYCGGRTFELSLGKRFFEGENLTIDGRTLKPVMRGNGYYDIDLSGISDVNKRGFYVFQTGFGGNILSKLNESSRQLTEIVNKSGDFVDSAGNFNDDDKKWFKQLWSEMSNYAGTNSGQYTPPQNQTVFQYNRAFAEAIGDYEKIVDYYPAETNGAETYAETGLKRGIKLAQDFGQSDVQTRLINKLISKYPKTDGANGYTYMINQQSGFDSSLATQAIELDDGVKVIRLLNFNTPKERSSAELLVAGRNVLIYSKDSVDFTRQGKIYLDSVDVEQATIRAYCADVNGVFSNYASSYVLRINQQEVDVCGMPMRVLRTTAKEAAKIRLYPSAQGTQTLTNFSVHIGIEKRAIKISPDKAREKIENLNKSIKQWEDISKKLGNVVTGMKSACFATSAVLTFKNFMGGLSGETLARQQVMNGDNGWRNRCSAMVGEGKYSTIDQCYLSNSGEIDSEVGKTTNAINKVNQKIQEIQSRPGIVQTTDIFGQSVDSEKLRAALAAEAINGYGTKTIDVSNLSKKWFDKNGQQINQITVAELLSADNLKSGAVTTDSIRQIMLNSELAKSGIGEGQKKNVDSYLQNTAGKINDYRIAYQDIEKAKVAAQRGLASPIYANPDNQQMRVAPVVRLSDSLKNELNFGSEITHSATIVVPPSAVEGKTGETGTTFNGGTYYLGLTGEETTEGVYGIKSIYFADEKKVLSETEVGQFSSKYGLGNIKSQDRVSYSNPIAATDRKCRFYETEPYRGMPAIIPFDSRNGWYAATRQTLPAFGGIGAFDASGRVTSFWICNAGDNSRVEFESGFGDDLCQQVNLNTGQPLGSFPGLSDAEARTKISQAINAIEQAARQYPNKVITVNGERCEVGAPSSGQPGTQCQDFMSPKDCLLLFNVCDPVICPPSRCNLGGKYPVADVAQTGIVGSVFLCLPNIQEGVAIPVCLTGIQAGIDGWTSIMKNYRDCLQENIDTGQTVGICDQIHSIYVCEFFWGQVAPFVNVIIPKLIEIAYGQGVRGGGEYLTVQSAWQNMENSINYFTNSYAVNSLNAFRARTNGAYGSNPYSIGSVAEIGTAFCKNFISVKAPKAFEALVEPDSPPQFHAWFDEKTYTTVTVPATSQYKVFYHIFAGNDAGVQFRVYLKSPPDSSYYSTNPTVMVDSGFVARGQYASNTKDFTAPQGYKELCVMVNTEEQCGFGQVSTSFAVNYLRDSYINSELQRTTITSERECISGSNNPGALLTPNVQAGVESFVSPDIYNRGVVRICSTDNPGKGTDPTRFVNVGYCDNQKVGCWIDKNSVSNALTPNNLGAKNETLQVLQQRADQYLVESGDVLSEDQALSEIQSLQLAMEGLRGTDILSKAQDILNRIDYVAPKLIFNNHKARLILIRAQVNEKVARQLKLGSDALKPTPNVPVQGEGGVSGGNAGGSSGSGGASDSGFVGNPNSYQFIAGDELIDPPLNYRQLYVDNRATSFFVDSSTNYVYYKASTGNYFPIGKFENRVLTLETVAIMNKPQWEEIPAEVREKLDRAVLVNFVAVQQTPQVGSVQIPSPLTLENAIEFLENRIYSVEGYARVKYGDANYQEFTNLVDVLFANEIIENYEYVAINGRGLFNLAENTVYTLDLLKQKKAALISDGSKGTGVSSGEQPVQQVLYYGVKLVNSNVEQVYLGDSPIDPPVYIIISNGNIYSPNQNSALIGLVKNDGVINIPNANGNKNLIALNGRIYLQLKAGNVIQGIV